MTRKMLGAPFAAMLFMAVCHGAETMAYHFASEPAFPITRISDCPLLKAAPAATPFVNAGDELRDLTEVMRSAKVPLADGWAVWNQTQRLLVVHGSMMDQWRIDGLTEFRAQTRHAKMTFDWILSEKSETSIHEKNPVFASVGLLSKSDMKSTATSRVMDPSGDWSFSVEGEFIVDETNRISSLLDVSWQGPDGDNAQHGELSTYILIKDGSTQPLASWLIAGHGPAWRLTINGEVLLSDGTAWRKALLRQVGDKSEIVVPIDELHETDFRELPAAGDRKLLTKAFERHHVRDLVGLSSDQNPAAADPFAEPPMLPDKPSLDLPDLVIPAHLGGTLNGSLLDLRAPVTAAGVPLGADDFVAYDPLAERLVVYCKEEKTLHMVEQLFMIMYCRGLSPNIECAAWLSDASMPNSPLVTLSLLTRSGRKSGIEIRDAKDQPIATFEVAPTQNESETIVELSYDFNCQVQHQSTTLNWHSQSSVNLTNDTPTLNDATKLPDGRSLKQGLRAKIVE